MKKDTDKKENNIVDPKNSDNTKSRKSKKDLLDDGRTISNMNVEGFNWYIPEKNKRQRKDLSGMNITKEERRAMIKGALLAILPLAFAFIGIFFAIFLMIYLWLS